ncbi:RluA family pseudouridine synthase [Lacticaseibacillus porcinae]|uniref:RluA family pseudouridine synthase n=1 Tax=Lacticaseibacillus porcinae TaxID=1123687 RepID=UPI001CDBE154|nr:RluA family pseudouridine synthase [Lacticaseibacillus porcinae]
MKLTWTYQDVAPIKLYTFLRQIGMARMQIKKAKFHGGEFFVNAESVHTNYVVHQGDEVDMVLAPDKVSDQVIPYPAPLDIVYEDRDYLVVNKPAGIASIPDVAKSPDTMANRVKAYLIATHAESTAIHVVTRLDRDTSGLMLFAKHSLAHSVIDSLLHTDNMQKHYLALVSGHKALPPHGWLVLRLGRTTDFYMHRGVVADGKVSVTEYRTLADTDEAKLVRVRLHTGRTHQIRAHFAAIGHPLYGDDLYGGPAVPELDHQALHCAQLDFWQPLTQQMIHLQAPLPDDMQQLATRLQLKTANLI